MHRLLFAALLFTATPAAAQRFIPSFTDANGVWHPARVETSATAPTPPPGAPRPPGSPTTIPEVQPAPPLSAYRPMSRRRETATAGRDLGERYRIGGATPDANPARSTRRGRTE
jgi:hypothetical protein